MYSHKHKIKSVVSNRCRPNNSMKSAMQYTGNRAEVNFRPTIALARKYRIVPASSPWVSEDGDTFALTVCFSLSHL